MPAVIIIGGERPPRQRGEQDYRQGDYPEGLTEESPRSEESKRPPRQRGEQDYREGFAPEGESERFSDREEERNEKTEQRFWRGTRPSAMQRISGRLSSRGR
jgi:hypothetical protein